MQNFSLSKLLGILGSLLLVVAWWFLGWWVLFLREMIFTPLEEGVSDFATRSSAGQFQIAFNRFLESGFGGFLFVAVVFGISILIFIIRIKRAQNRVWVMFEFVFTTVVLIFVQFLAWIGLAVFMQRNLGVCSPEYDGYSCVWPEMAVLILLFGVFFVIQHIGLDVWRERSVLEKKDERHNILRSLKHNCIIIISIALVLTFVSLFLSYRKINSPSMPASAYSENIFPPVATGGFPILAFEYPSPALGSDIPPPESMAPFLYNFLFWVFISAVISFAIPKKWKDDAVTEMLFITAALFCVMIGFLYLMVQYD